MGRLIVRLILFLLVVGALGLVGYAYFGDLTPEQTDVSEPVNLNGN